MEKEIAENSRPVPNLQVESSSKRAAEVKTEVANNKSGKVPSLSGKLPVNKLTGNELSSIHKTFGAKPLNT